MQIACDKGLKVRDEVQNPASMRGGQGGRWPAMAVATSTRSLEPIAVGNRRGDENRSNGEVPTCRIALDDELSLLEI